MPLQSAWFHGNSQLEKCLVSDPAHVQLGAVGDHVSLIQGALQMIEGSLISQDEQTRQAYGQSTADAVLRYKTKRKIINFTYQTSADNIVGRMTMQSLDTEMRQQEQRKSRLLLSFGISLTPPKAVIISQSHPLPAAWAQQLVNAHKPTVLAMPSPVNGTPEQILASLKTAIATANGGMLIFAVGHGITNSQFPTAGGFDVADNAKMRIGGLGSFADAKTFVDVFYDDKPPKGSTVPFSQKELDERTHPAGSKRRLDNFAVYQDLVKAFVGGKLAAVVLLTCNVGNSLDFVKKVASQWQTPIVAYRDFTVYKGGFPRGRVRAVLSKDEFKDKSTNPGTNTPFAEVMFPLSLTDMVLIKP